MAISLSTEQRAKIRLLDSKLEVYAASCLKILDKSGTKMPFIFNQAQLYVHECLEKQLEKTGKVRALILKGRQQGISTYVAARFYHKTSMNDGQRAFIVSHEQKSTDNLFSMVKRYHENNPMPISTGATNAKELIFDQLDGGYKLATAGTSDVGRGNNAQLLHGSEFGFWSNAAMHLAGIGNTIGDIAGTEMIFESTANGLGNQFHTMWQDAEAGKSEYIAIFVPWFWQTEYRAPIRNDLALSSDDVTYQNVYGLDMEQMQWRQNKIQTYGAGHEWLFDQEYPATAALAFKTSTQNPLISPNNVMGAANSQFRERLGPLIIGCDPAGDGEGDGDRTAIAFRQGRTCFRLEYHEKKSPMQIAGILAGYYQEFKPDGLLIDKGGLGAGIYDRLVEMNIPVIGINNAERARDSERYENKRAEMWWLMAEWFADQPNRIPNDSALISDICAPQPERHSSGRKLLESKKNMKKRGIRSPDGADALALTFAETIAERAPEYVAKSSYKAPTSAGY
ncbi:hypothetical protein [Polynucleobacter sp. UK-Kesae-W10]|uniref:hypothetical protein n=1 Tax=Polynucleobacter sp. UK-Kesae-W10 TaxID=1819738 RepID=UPI001C0AF3CD|nr:hypothetical protein [Polynucleobacter sp. UK-Kesae-W10]MBU3577569.1 hypothetical protein [Polynucleobacter sp. UK-Kesae-W10]